ncbi:MAG: 50S ribosomal protein L32 [Candidatus Obscuribacterales bacterium]|nr:50S ribosomal protein L32 [Candidatus Obscuribacterales bacterium]
MPQPKKKTSHQKQAQRRAANYKLVLAPTMACPNCNSPKLSHVACSGCGYYRGRPARRRDWLLSD